MDIDTMPAGAEVDALMGQHVFGHEVFGLVRCTPDMELQHSFYVPYEGPDPHGVLRPVYLAHCVCDLPKEAVELGDADYWGHTAGCLEAEREWSEWIAAAWEVVEKLLDGGHCPGLLYDDNDHWALSLGGAQNVPYGDGPNDIATSFFVEANDWADTAPLAICCAALKAVEE